MRRPGETDAASGIQRRRSAVAGRPALSRTALSGAPRPLAPARVRGVVARAAIVAASAGFAWLSLALTRDDGGVTAVWLANAVVVAGLLPGPPRRAVWTLPAVLVAHVAVCVALGDPPLRAVGLALANVCEIGLALWGLWQLGLARPRMERAAELARFLLVAGLAAPLAPGALATLAAAPAGPNAALAGWAGWAVTHGLGMILLGPPLLIFRAAWVRRRRPAPRELAEWAAVSAVGTLVTVWVFVFAPVPMAYLVTPVILLYAFRLGMLGTAVALVEITAIALLCTWLELGPFNLITPDVAGKFALLHGFLAISFAIGMPVAAALAGRGRILAALRESELRFRRIADAAPMAIFVTDRDRELTYVNPAWSRLTGIPLAEATSARFERMVVDWGPDGREDRYRPRVPGEVSSRELTLRGGDGRPIVARHEIAAEFDDDGEYRGLVGMIADLTRERAVQAALADREAQLALLARNMTDAVFRFTLDGRCLYASPSAAVMFGLSLADVESKGLIDHVHPDDAGAVLTGLASLARGESERELLSFRWRTDRAGEDWAWLEANSGLVRNAAGRPAELLASIRDISARKRLEQELVAARRHAEAAAAAKSSFLANMSHDIRTPMNGVLGFAQLLLEDELTAEQRRQVQLIADSGMAMMRLLNDILDFSKIEAGRMALANEPVELGSLLGACLKLVTPSAEQAGLALACEIDPALPAWLLGDPLRLRQVVLNLLGNAVKFTERGSVRLSARRVGREGGAAVAIAVEDSGAGIPADRLESVFRPFEQGDAATPRRFGGSGLGLSISRQLAELMGGALVVESVEGQGSRFELTLPLVEPEAPSALAAPRRARLAAEPAGTGGRILVAEDHDVNRLVASAMLAKLGHRITLAEDGAEALALATEAAASATPFDLVLMDLQMPRLDGYAAARAIRDAGIAATTLPILALTANVFPDDIARVREAGMQGHLAKPLVLAELEPALARVLARARGEPARPPCAATGADIEPLWRRRRGEALAAVSLLLRRGTLANAELETLAGLVHKLAGAAGMFGEDELGRLAGLLEARLRDAAPASDLRSIARALLAAA